MSAQPPILDADRHAVVELICLLRKTAEQAKGRKLQNTARAWAGLLVSALGQQQSSSTVPPFPISRS